MIPIAGAIIKSEANEMARRLLGVVLVMLLAVRPATAQDLKLGMSAAPTTIDPLLFAFVPNNQVKAHIFDTLLYYNHGNIGPRLAESWIHADDTTWDFRLRAGVKFHDNSDLTAEDVAFSIDRADKVPNSPASSFAQFTRGIAGVEITGPLTFRVHTKAPDAYLPYNLTNISIQAKPAVAGRKSEDFNSGIAAIGTGAYRFVSWSPGLPVVLARNDTYWGPAPDWANVTIRPISDQAAREIALMTGEVDFIESVPPQDAEKLTENTNLRVMHDLPNGVILLQLDQSRDGLPSAFDNDGKPMESNPFKEKRVRLALSKAINREAIVRQIVAGSGIPASQLMPDGNFGVSTRLKPEAFDPGGARALLAQAGFPAGFRVTLYALNDRYAGDAAGAQAIAQMLTRVGVKTEVVALPGAVFFPKFTRSELPFNLSGWFAGETFLSLRAPLGTADPARGWGAINRGRYSNPELDAVLGRIQTTFDDDKRERLLAEASEVAMADVGAIPVYYPLPILGMRRTLTFDVALAAHSIAGNIHPVEAESWRALDKPIDSR